MKQDNNENSWKKWFILLYLPQNIAHFKKPEVSSWSLPFSLTASLDRSLFLSIAFEVVKYEAVISQNGHYSMRLKEQQLCEEGLENRSESCIHVPCALCFIQPLSAIHVCFYPGCLSALVNVLIRGPNVYSHTCHENPCCMHRYQHPV